MRDTQNQSPDKITAAHESLSAQFDDADRYDRPALHKLLAKLREEDKSGQQDGEE